MSKNAKIANSMRQSKWTKLNTLDANLIAFLVMKEHSRADPNIFCPIRLPTFPATENPVG